MNIQELIEYAIEKEVMSRRMYETVAERCEDDEARMMILQLAGFEATHIDIFTRALEPEIKKLSFDVQNFIKDCEIRPFRLSNVFDQSALDQAGLEEVLKVARGFEKSMSEFYGSIADTVPGETIKSMGKRLAGEELGHYEYISRIEGILGLSSDVHDEEFHAQ
ncbi:MAG TPA: ferritin family protein [Thermoanaerobaculia bacterium]|nr:ferritin family protein [Thermoanaerobaculia bacterium]HUM29277.1 ferritin family protein [Thermoanaerobaculia bacterium]HXK67765.1 ferritin family protein [Thermoanaerobaculia bacterium]